MAWTSADVDTLKAALLAGKGAQRIEFNDQVIQFQSIDQMLKLLAVMQGDVAATAGNTSGTRYAATSKGC